MGIKNTLLRFMRHLLEVGFHTTTPHAQLVFWLYENQLPAKRDGHGFKPHTGQLRKEKKTSLRKNLAPRPKILEQASDINNIYAALACC